MEKADRDADEPPAWREIQRLAAGLIQKSRDDLSEAQAIWKVLATAEGQRLYRSYCRSKSLARPRA